MCVVDLSNAASINELVAGQPARQMNLQAITPMSHIVNSNMVL